MDYSLPKKVNPEFIQNRDREGGASQEQILNISAKPDYLRLSTSNMLADGAGYFMEIGPGTVLQGLVKRISGGTEGIVIEGLSSL